MQTRITSEEVQAAARQLAKTAQGRTAMNRLLALLDTDDLELDLLNQRAFLALLGGAWNGQGEVVRRTMTAALEATKQGKPAVGA